MTEFTSNIKEIKYPIDKIYNTLSDFEKIGALTQNLSTEKIENIVFEQNSCSITVSPVGKIKFVIVDKEPLSTIKLTTEEAPFSTNMWIQLKPNDENSTYIKLTMRAEIPALVKPLVSKHIQNALDNIVSLLQNVPYSTL